MAVVTELGRYGKKFRLQTFIEASERSAARCQKVVKELTQMARRCEKHWVLRLRASRCAQDDKMELLQAVGGR
jgi:hypothetical protein